MHAAGIDEAGRGCLAGPVVAAAVILPARFNLPGLADSKKLTDSKRESLAPAIRACAVAWSLGVIWPRRICEINILQATFEAMAKAARSLAQLPAILQIDGPMIIPAPVMSRIWPNSYWPPAQEAIVRGDDLVPAISAASIIAKTFRDHLMNKLDKRWPGYGFAKHKGYGTREHKAALASFGPSPLHRLTFRGVCRT